MGDPRRDGRRTGHALLGETGTYRRMPRMPPHVVELDLGAIPSPAGSGELLLADEWSCRLVFVPSGGGGLGAPPRTAMATFQGCLQVVFGYPNDEAHPGHPLYSNWSYGFYEALGSDWRDRLEAQNRVAFPDWTTPWQRRHFLVVCHESLVEVLAEDVRVEVFERRFADVAADALRRNLHDHQG
jgi:hypothetical protein